MEQKSQINSPTDDSADFHNLDNIFGAAKTDFCENGSSESKKTADKKMQQDFEQFIQKKQEKIKQESEATVREKQEKERKQQEFEQYLQEKKDKEQKHRNENFKMLSLITQFGINMLVPIFLCFFIGMFLDRKLGTNYIAILLFFIGAVAGFRNVYIFAKKSTKNNNTANNNTENNYRK